MLEWRLYTYSLPLRKPLHLAHTTLQQRQGFLLRLSDTHGRQVWGDIAPLPGFHREDRASALDALKDLLSNQTFLQRASRILETDNTTFSEVAGLTTQHTLPPSVCFGVDMALMQYASLRVGLNAIGRSTATQPFVRVQALLTGHVEDLQARWNALQKRGFTHIKLKVGRVPIDVDVKRILSLRELVGPDIRIRLDANRAWTLEEACTLAKDCSSADIEYIEEPCLTPDASFVFAEKTGLSIALEETVEEAVSVWENMSSLRERGVQALILKPSWIGGIGRTMEWIDKAHDAKLVVNISSMFESAIGRGFLTCMAAYLPESSWMAMGLDTGKYIAEDIVHSPVSVEGGTLDVTKSGASMQRVRTERLEEVIW